MRREQIMSLLQQRPFQPFRMRLSNGIVQEVRHPEMAMATASSVIVGMPATSAPAPAIDDYVIVSLLHIVQLEPIPTPVTPTSN